MADIKKIASETMADLNAVDIEGAMNMVKGSAVSMGMEVTK
jgi:Ribosomal protein L11